MYTIGVAIPRRMQTTLNRALILSCMIDRSDKMKQVLTFCVLDTNKFLELNMLGDTTARL